MEAKNYGKLTWHCCMSCYPTNGRVEFEGGWLLKSGLTTKDGVKRC